MSRLSEPTHTIRVLHIDDEPNYLELTKLFLEESNPLLQIQSCIDPEQVISELKSGDFDCVLSDYLMDEMDGIELASKIRETSDIPIIMYTGQGSEEVAERAFEIGIDDYIRKEAFSSHYQVLAKRIVSAVARKRTHDLLAESEEKYRRLWEDSSDGLVIVDKQSGGILDFNEEFTRQSGRDQGELQSLKLWDIQPSTAGESIREKFLEERDEGSEFATEIQFQKPSGEIVDIDLLSREIKIGGRKVLQSRCRDITEEKRYRDRLEAIHRHASELGQTRDEKEVSKFTLDGIEEIFGFQKMSFSLIEGETIRPVEIRSDTPLARTEIPFDGLGLIPKVARTGESVLISDVRKEPDYFMARESTRSELTVPVKIGDKVVAVINIESSELDAFSREDQRLVETFAEHIASAISINRESSKLGLSEEKYRSLFESTHEGVLISGPDGRYTSANPAAAAMLGYDSSDDIVGQSAVDFYANPKQRDELFETLMEKGFITDYDYEIKRKDGSHGIISANVTLHKTDDGGILRSEVFFRDITERKRIENQLRESETLYRELAEKSIDVIYRVDLEGRLLYISPAIGVVAGYNHEEVIGKPFISFLPEDEIPKISKAMQNALEGNQVQLFETMINHKDGSKVSVAINSSPLLRDGKIIGFQGILRDVTEHALMIEELRMSEEKWRSLVDLSPDGIGTMNMKGVITWVNEGFLRLTGYPREEIVGKHFSKVKTIRARDIPRYLKIFAQVLRGRLPTHIEFTYVHRDGSTRWAEGHFSFLKAGEDREVLGYLIDISKYKALETRLRDHSGILEREVEEKTMELLDTERMVTAGKIASMVGHDLRGPLSLIKNSLYLIEHKPELLEKLKPSINNSVDYALNMLEELRLTTRTAEPNLIQTNLGKIVQRAVDEAQIPPEVEVKTQIGEGLASARLDPTQIRRVLDNLIRNAVEAMPEGGTLVLSLEDEDGGLILKVVDTGDGIPEEEMTNIFKPFYTTKSNGMGLGLAYCRRAVEAHGGAIAFVSEVGVGTTFTVMLPVKPD